MDRPRKGGEAGELLASTRRKMKRWGITVSFVAREMGVSRQYAWQVVHQRTVVSEERAREFEHAVEAIIGRRENLATFGDRLRAARVAAGLTLKQVAALIGYSWVGVERWERNVCLPKPGVLWHLLSLYGINQTGYEMAPSPRGNSGHFASRSLLGAREDLALSLRAASGKFTSAAQRFQREPGIPGAAKGEPGPQDLL
jgi:transcriptional regulator with XRE-family HTH domain